jgi:hypothetical protein
MLVGQAGGSHDAGPVVGKAGYWDSNLVVVKSQLVGHGGVNTVVNAASGAVPPWIAVGADI